MVRAAPTETEQGLSASYLRSIVPTDKMAPQWLQAVAKHVPRMQRWWRCISTELTDTPKARSIRRAGLCFMLEAVVQSESQEEQAVILQSIREWGDDWRDRGAHLDAAMEK